MISPTPYKNLRSKVRAAIGMSVGAPEIVCGALSKSSFDPFFTWFMVALKFWHFCLFSEGGRDVIAKVRKNAKGCLLSRLVLELTKMNVHLDHESISDDDSEVRWVPWWATVKPELASFLKRAFWKILETRRPNVFLGLKELGIDTAQHRKLVDAFSAFHSMIIMRFGEV